MNTYIKTIKRQNCSDEEDGKTIFLLVAPTIELYSIESLMQDIVKPNGIDHKLLAAKN